MARLVSVDDLKDAMGIVDTVDDAALGAVCDAATRRIQAECGRQFVAEALSARLFRPLTAAVCFVDDVATDAGLVVEVDESGDGSGWVQWDPADWQLEPLNGVRLGQAWPYTAVRGVAARRFPPGMRARVRVTAEWGWPGGPPAPVAEAAKLQAVSVYKSGDAPLGIAGFGDIGIMRLRQALHPVAQALIAEYRRDPVPVA